MYTYIEIFILIAGFIIILHKRRTSKFMEALISLRMTKFVLIFALKFNYIWKFTFKGNSIRNLHQNLIIYEDLL